MTGFPSGDAFYFHPAGFVGNFVGGGDCHTDWTKGYHRKIERQNLYNKYICEAAKKYNIDPMVYKALLAQESNFQPLAKNKFGFAGISQVGWKEWTIQLGKSKGNTSKSTGKWVFDMKGDKRFDVKESIFGGAKILESKKKAIDNMVFSKYTIQPTKEEKWYFYTAAYNGGEGTISRAWGLKPNGTKTYAKEFYSSIFLPLATTCTPLNDQYSSV